MSVTLYWAPKTRSFRTLWLLEELSIEYSVFAVDLFCLDSISQAEFRKASPLGKVPAIQDRAVNLWDSAAISLYLCDRYSKADLAPCLEDQSRADYLFWTGFVPGFLEPAFAEHVRGIHSDRYSNGWGDWQSVLELLSGRIYEREWLLGDRFSGADVLVGSCIEFFAAQGLMQDAPELMTYARRCVSRPAYKSAVEWEVQAALRKSSTDG